MRIAFILLLISVACYRHNLPMTPIENDDDDDPALTHVDSSNIKSEAKNGNDFNPTNLKFSVTGLSIKENASVTTDDNVVYTIPVTTAYTANSWKVDLSKKDGAAITKVNSLIDATPNSKVIAVGEVDYNFGKIRTLQFFYSPVYDSAKAEVYLDTFYVKARDVAWCKQMVEQLALTGSLPKFGTITPDITAETNPQDCENIGHAFNFDQVITLNVAVENNAALHKAKLADQEMKDNLRLCATSAGLAAGMGILGQAGVLDFSTTKVYEGDNLISEKTDFTWGNVIKAAGQFLAAIATIVISYSAASKGVNCNNIGGG